MCGIFGLFVSGQSTYESSFIARGFNRLALLSESRGKDSSGLVFRDEDRKAFKVFKGSLTLRDLLKSPSVVPHIARQGKPGGSRHLAFAAMGHSRLVTNGSQISNENNQPVVKDEVIAIHNGIIVNEAELWEANPDLKRTAEIDTEVMLSLVRKGLKASSGTAQATANAMNAIFGTASVGLFFTDLPRFALATNNGSLYTLSNGTDFLAFASEAYFLHEVAKDLGLDATRFKVAQIEARQGMILDLETFRTSPFTLDEDPGPDGTLAASAIPTYAIELESISDGKPQRELVLDPAIIAKRPGAAAEARILEYNIDRIRGMKRCTRCILPESFPFIEFDEKGVCNYCNHYRPKNKPKPLEELLNLVEPYRSRTGDYDCIVPYSGGRDSTHTLHVVKNVLKLKPIAFTYDWGMVTDLARRNIARVCGKMGVENIIVSADIHLKRRNIRKNILAWLKRPHLGMVPLFMAGDKYFFYYTDQIRKQTGLKLNIWGINSLENTDFKVGYLGVPPDHAKERIYHLSANRKLKLLAGVGGAILTNPSYLNSSVGDTIGSFISRSVATHRDYYHMYDYMRWDEDEVEDLVLNEYRWERAIDTRTTWRIGDGTAPFYNYIYYTVGGFSEYDTFRSNQIREGMMTREKAIALVEEENQPRYASIRWYTDIVGLDFETTIKTINRIPKLYS